ncbi:hypothetical protein CPB86DRAFT_559763 [Serendipita vermifera]|nr:hypothetical protein CPB86DRAFT_559763 [Serendipita vermifera]
MADAKARAAARREAILAGRSDRLAKLTTKAKNEGNVAGNVREVTDDPPLAELPTKPLSQGDSSTTSNALSPQRAERTPYTEYTPTPGRQASIVPEQLGWDLQQQQEQFMRALMMSQSREGTPQFTGVAQDLGTPNANPFMQSPDSMNAQSLDAPPKSTWEKILPLFRVFSVVLLLSFFMIQTNNSTSTSQTRQSPWFRWGDLASSSPPYEWSYGQGQFLWSFLSLQLCLHAIRLATSSFCRVP